MHSAPLQLPLKASEAAALSSVIFQQAEGRRLNEDLRRRLSARIQGLRLSSLAPLAESLERDPIHPSTYYLVADTGGAQPHSLLLRLALASSPSSGLFPNGVLIGRMRTPEHEVVVNASRFTYTDRENIRTFAEQVEPAFLPRPQGASPAISMEHERPEESLPAAFDAYRAILRLTGANVAAVAVNDRTGVDTAIWTAIRAGWREGYTVEAETDAVGNAPAGCTKFTVPASDRIEDLADIHDAIRARTGRVFDLEVSFQPHNSTVKDVAACLQFLRSRGTPAQFVCPTFQSVEQLIPLQESARQYGAMLSIRSIGLLPRSVLQRIGKATAGRVNYKICKPDQDGGPPGDMLVAAAEYLRP